MYSMCKRNEEKIEYVLVRISIREVSRLMNVFHLLILSVNVQGHVCMYVTPENFVQQFDVGEGPYGTEGVEWTENGRDGRFK